MLSPGSPVIQEQGLTVSNEYYDLFEFVIRLKYSASGTSLIGTFICVFGCREAGEDADSQGDGSSQPDTISIASRTSQNTVDSDKVQTHRSDL